MRVLLLVIGSLVLFSSCEREQLEVDKASSQLELVNGVLYYQNSPLDGLLIAKYNKTSYEMKLQYKDGRKNGYEKRWYSNGQLAQNRTYSRGVKIGDHLGWWENGISKFEYHFNEKGEYDGNRKEWYKNGQLVRDFNYLNGKEKGSQRMWASNGKIRANYVVKNGERFGLIGLKKCYTVNTDSNELQ